MTFWILIVAGILHLSFMVGELLPWSVPVLLRMASKQLPKDKSFNEPQRRLVANLVHNAGVYNGIVGGGLLWSAFVGLPGAAVAQVMLIGAAVAGVFGTLTLKSPVPAVQAAIGIFGLFFV